MRELGRRAVVRGLAGAGAWVAAGRPGWALATGGAEAERPLEEFGYGAVEVRGQRELQQRAQVMGVVLGLRETELLRPVREMSGTAVAGEQGVGAGLWGDALSVAGASVLVGPPLAVLLWDAAAGGGELRGERLLARAGASVGGAVRGDGGAVAGGEQVELACARAIRRTEPCGWRCVACDCRWRWRSCCECRRGRVRGREFG